MNNAENGYRSVEKTGKIKKNGLVFYTSNFDDPPLLSQLS